MREILFKSKRMDNGEWVQGYLAKRDRLEEYYIIQDIYEQISYGVRWMCSRFRNESFEVDPETVCQYTGLTDKNGVKIFEGDRCVFNGNEGDSDPYKVFWDAEDGRWSVKEESCGGTDSLDWFFSENCTVVGNIHDNA